MGVGGVGVVVGVVVGVGFILQVVEMLIGE